MEYQKMVLIAAVAENRVIGKKGRLPWADDFEMSTGIKEDMDRFKRLTTGHAVLMGRKTYKSLKRPLKNRLNVVVSRQQNIEMNSDIVVCDSLDKAIEKCMDFSKDEYFYVIGGEQIYRETIGMAHWLEITHIHRRYDGDAFFPEIDVNTWERVIISQRRGYEFTTYRKKSKDEHGKINCN